MNASRLTFPLALWLGLNVSGTLAQELEIPDSRQLQTMSIEEYETYRERMRSRMESVPAAEHEPEPKSAVPEREQAERRNIGDGYGRGYGTRNAQGSMQGRQGGGYGRGGGRRR